MNTKALLAITSHGNAPYLMAARLAIALGNYPVVIPHYYGDTQTAIMLEEISESSEQIFLSKELGDLLHPLLLDASNTMSFAQFGAQIANPKNPLGAQALETKLGNMLREGIPAESLDGIKRQRFFAKDLSAVINTAQPIRVNLPHSYFFFTAKMSDLYGLIPEGEISEETQNAAGELSTYSALWKMVEESFDCEFIPRINAFSYLSDRHDEKVIHTPPFAFKREPVNLLDRKSILFVPSGTRTDLPKLRQIAETIPAEYDCLVLGRNGMNGGFPVEEYKFVGAKVYSDPLLAGVISRGGWGTFWECLANNKPSSIARTTYIEDPEMGHTQKTMEHLGLSAIIDDSSSAFFNENTITGIMNALKFERENDFQKFGNHANDGYGYIAKKIHEIHEI